MQNSETTQPLRILSTCVLFAALCSRVLAQDAILSPSEFLGHELGTKFTLHHQVVDYAEYLAQGLRTNQNETGISLLEYGQSVEGRPLTALVFAHPEMHPKLDEIRSQHLDRMNGGTGLAAYDDVAIVWMSYNVHGNEAVCTEAALEVMHELAILCASGDEMMRNLVVLLDPCLNPDGHDRYAVWFNQYASNTPNPARAAIEHDEPWPGGRPNHYWFDLNRDWAWQKQQESQMRAALYHEWMPHVHCDYHEMGYNSPYYFAPAAEPYHEAITPWQREFQVEIGRAAAARFDERGELYYTRESFDLLYPSYGDTYPIYNGAIGMTYEQGGSGGAGVLIEKSDGELLSLRSRMDNHVETSMSAIEVSAKLSAALVREFANFHEANRTAPFGKFGGYLIPVNPENEARVQAFADFMAQHGIECERASTISKPQEAWQYGANSRRSVTAQPGDLLISSYQTHSRMLGVLFDPNPTLTDSLTYDITTWSVPFAYGLTTYGLNKPIQGEPWENTSERNTLGTSAYGYAIQPHEEKYATALAALHQAGIRMRTTSEPIVHANARFDRGTVFILAGDQVKGSDWQAAFGEVATAVSVVPVPLSGGHALEGPDMGSDKVWLLEPPRVAMLTGEETSSLGSGEVWWHFEQELGYPITRMNAKGSNPLNWDQWNVVILPSGWYAVADEAWLNDLQAWTRAGGRVIAIQGALGAFEGASGWGLQRYDDEGQRAAVSSRSRDERASNQLKPFEERERHYAMEIGDGSIYSVDLDRTHPLAWGYPDQPYYTLRSTSNRYAPLTNGWTVGRYGPQPAPVSGFVGSRANRELGGSMVFGTQSVGRGHITYLADNPLFRGFWENGKRLFDNAVFMPMN